MNKTLSNKVLLQDFVLFSLLGVIIWSINVFGQSGFSGNNLFPFFLRSVILSVLIGITYYLNKKFIKKNQLDSEILKFKLKLIKLYIGGIAFGCTVIGIIYTIVYFIYPFEIIVNQNSKINPIVDIISYSLGNTLEELLFRVFLLLASEKLFGKIGGILVVSFLFGLFHLQGTGFKFEGLNIVMTTFTMSLLFIAIIYYTNSIWTAVTFHIVLNLLLHTLGLDGANNGLFQLRFFTTNINGHYFTFIYEVVVIVFALIIFYYREKENKLLLTRYCQKRGETTSIRHLCKVQL